MNLQAKIFRELYFLLMLLNYELVMNIPNNYFQYNIRILNLGEHFYFFAS